MLCSSKATLPMKHNPIKNLGCPSPCLLCIIIFLHCNFTNEFIAHAVIWNCPIIFSRSLWLDRSNVKAQRHIVLHSCKFLANAKKVWQLYLIQKCILVPTYLYFFPCGIMGSHFILLVLTKLISNKIKMQIGN